MICAFVAAAVIAAAARPHSRGPVREELLDGTPLPERAPLLDHPAIGVAVSEDGRKITLFRKEMLDPKARFRVRVTLSGFDVTITEEPGRLRPDDPPAAQEYAVDLSHLLALERYHFRYDCGRLGRSAAFTLTLRPGITLTRELM